ncbi:MAG: polysaccharide biosynthesis C-terminal domain-containing protein [candidate division Zixibacteria bacterium]|nr:polysaccharide biosynthesis C-terminal domain-containing protein [candidate division Zixibacteria bacterium]
MLKTGLANIFLRALTLAGKFLVLLSIAHYLPPEQVGVWGLMNVTITISLYFLGLDFYIFNTREILAQEEPQRTPLIRDQIIFHGLVYIVVLPLLLTVFVAGVISWKYAVWFYLLLVLEHLSQEATRVLITLSRPTMANLVLFLRGGAWTYAVVGIIHASGDARRLPVIWMGWAIGVTLSIVVAAAALRRLPWGESRRVGINWTWMRRGVTVALPFFLATLSFEGIQYVDRYFLQHFRGDAMVGIYTFYTGIANVIQTFTFSGVIMILYPQIIAAYQRSDFPLYRRLMKKMALGTVGSLVILTALALILIKPVLHLIDRPLYAEHMSVFYIILFSVGLMTLSYLPHYALYAKRRDSAIIAATVTGLGFALAANAVLVPRFGLPGAAAATAGAIAVMALIKTGTALKGSRTKMAFLFEDPDGGDSRDSKQGAA